MSKKKSKVEFPSDAELLGELATLDEVEAYIPTVKDHQAGSYPDWCELTLRLQRLDDGTLKPSIPIFQQLLLRRHDGELIIQVLHDVLHPGHKSGSTEEMWAALDAVVDRIQKRVRKGKSPQPEDRGEALGLATAIALIDNPFKPDVDAVREVAMERYELRR